MKRLYIATETTGMWNFKLHDDTHADQPHMIRLAWVLDDTDELEPPNGSNCFIIKPAAGWVMEPGAERSHGISLALAKEYGSEGADALAAFALDLNVADQVLGFGLDFHLRVLRRAAGEYPEAEVTPKNMPSVDIMRACLPLFNDDLQTMGFPKGRAVSLPDAYRYFTREEIPDFALISQSDPVDAGHRKVLAIRAIHLGLLTAA